MRSDITTINQRIGSTLRERRIMKGLSQEALANVIGVTFQQVQKYERGINSLSIPMLIKVSAALDMPAQQFLEIVIHPQLPVASSAKNDRLRMETVRRLFSLPEKRQRAVIDVIKALEDAA